MCVCVCVCVCVRVHVCVCDTGTCICKMVHILYCQLATPCSTGIRDHMHTPPGEYKSLRDRPVSPTGQFK